MDLFSGAVLVSLIKTVGYIGIFSIVFAESGLFFGFFLPGDSLLFTAGLLASQGYLNIWLTVVGISVAAILGDNVGYAFGRKVGPKIFRREDSRFFHKDNLIKAEKFYQKHGPLTIVIARFMPFIRTFAPIVAGVGKMHYKTFLLYNIAGGLIWSFSLPLSGYYLTELIPDIESYITYVILLIIFLSTFPIVFHWLKSKNK
ncbi:VTT domain-containing protein [Patescibacteria group bacterium]|nr:VTT domain-containing protein [Patescibacteria group bacterium]